MLRIIFFFMVIIAFLSSCSSKKEDVDLIIHHATIYSVDSAFTVYEAMCIKDGKIMELNTNEALLKKHESQNTIDAQGKTIFPGFIDAHCHFLGYGLGLQQVDLVGTKSYPEVIERVVAFSKREPVSPDGNQKMIRNTGALSHWLIGRGWDQNDWDKKEYPDNVKLDSLFPNRPVLLTRIDGHAALANSAALKLAGITATTNIAGGEIVKSGKKLTGILIDNAVDLVKNAIPETSRADLMTALLNAQTNCLAVGLTTVDDAGLMKNDIDVIDELQKAGKLKMRMYVMLSDSLPNYQYYLEKGPYKTERLNVCSFKFYADGALGSRGACLHNSYADKTNWKGFLLNTKDHFEKSAKLMAEKGFQMNTHCIGDSAYGIILAAYKKAGATKEKRWRIEHAQVVDPKDMNASDCIVPSVQPTHATSDMYWAKDRLGETRVKYAYAYKDLLKVSGMVALGTDFPVEDISPFKTFYAAVARQDSKGFPDKGFQTENALSREETLKGMTIWAAYSNFEEKEKGSLEKGKYADFIILDTDVMTCKIADVLNTKVISTFINGEKVYWQN
jgi:predicted amidohydrolase YtcJ